MYMIESKSGRTQTTSEDEHRHNKQIVSLRLSECIDGARNALIARCQSSIHPSIATRRHIFLFNLLLWRVGFGCRLRWLPYCLLQVHACLLRLLRLPFP